MPAVYLKEGARRLVESGFLTIYSKWVDYTVGAVRGGFADVYLGGECVGSGFYEGVGVVGVRILSSECGVDPRSLVYEALDRALRLRRLLAPWDSYRLVNAEGDRLPGLIIDVYSDVVVVQTSSLGFDRHLDLVADWVEDRLSPRLVYLKNDQRSRREAGLPVERRVLRGEGPAETKIREGRAKFWVDVERGQKTGFFLDQRVNRLRLGELVWSGARILDLYSYTGGFAVHALLAGAEEAVLVEESPHAVKTAERNLAINGVKSRATIHAGRVEDFLGKTSESYDIVVADPPALIPGREYRGAGMRAYRRLYKAAARLVKPGGLLLASSCSYFLGSDEFLQLLGEAVHSAGREATILWMHGASPDHVSRPQDEFLRYLKVVIMRLD